MPQPFPIIEAGDTPLMTRQERDELNRIREEVEDGLLQLELDTVRYFNEVCRKMKKRA